MDESTSKEDNFYAEQLNAQRGMLATAIRALMEERDKLKNTVNQLQSRNHEIRSIVYHLFHTVRGPLTTIEGLLSLMADDLDTEKGKMLMDRARFTIDKLDLFSTNLARSVEALFADKQLEKVDLEQVYHNVLKQLNQIYNVDNFKCMLEIHCAENRDVLANILVVERLLFIHLQNAMEFADKAKAENVIKVKFRVCDDAILFTVNDNGIGMDNAVRNRAREMFFRGHNQSSGHGLGLYFASVILDELNGQHKLFSQKDKGTMAVFKLSL